MIDEIIDISVFSKDSQIMFNIDVIHQCLRITLSDSQPFHNSQ